MCLLDDVSMSLCSHYSIVYFYIGFAFKLFCLVYVCERFLEILPVVGLVVRDGWGGNRYRYNWRMFSGLQGCGLGHIEVLVRYDGGRVRIGV